MKSFIKGISALLILVMGIMLNGCETFKGTGRDISNFGKLVSGD